MPARRRPRDLRAAWDVYSANVRRMRFIRSRGAQLKDKYMGRGGQGIARGKVAFVVGFASQRNYTELYNHHVLGNPSCDYLFPCFLKRQGCKETQKCSLRNSHVYQGNQCTARCSSYWCLGLVSSHTTIFQEKEDHGRNVQISAWSKSQNLFYRFCIDDIS